MDDTAQESLSALQIVRRFREMNKILIFVPHYYPGFRSGGPAQSMINLVDVFGDQCNFSIYTHNHDMGVSEPYENIISDAWNRVGKAEVFYSSKANSSLKELSRTIKGYDLVYLCGAYHQYTNSVLLLKRFGKISADVILAPMGVFSEGALAQKWLKKMLYWKIFKQIGLFKGLIWSFTSELEKRDAINTLGKEQITDYFIAEDLPRKYQCCLNMIEARKKEAGEAKLVFLSRICKEKNLIFALQVISKIHGNITFDIYGPQEDENYWRKCKKLIDNLPKNVKCTYKGMLVPDRVIEILMCYDICVFPTLGENFGHVIYEALMSGCVPVISDKTSWGEIAVQGCGKVISLENTDEWVKEIQFYVDMNCNEFMKIKLNSMQYAKIKYQASIANSGYKRLLRNYRNAINR